MSPFLKFVKIMKKYLRLLITFVLLVMICTVFFKCFFEEKVSFCSVNELENNKVEFSDILKNNLLVCSIAIIGIFSYKIPTICVYFFNAFTLGFVLGLNWAVTGEIVYFLRILIPHGMFEIPAIVMACELGFMKKRHIEKNVFLKKIVLIYSLIVIAAILESFVSVRLI